MVSTEQDSHFSHLESMSVREILTGINQEDQSVPLAVEAAIPAIERLVEGIVARGGRIFYMGAGTSGRLGVVDASEIPPTYGVEGRFIGIIAGGDTAFRNAVEGAEDDPQQGIDDLLAFHPTPADTLIGISASGNAPYVVGAVRKARELGLLTGCISCNAEGALAQACECPVVALVGPEFVTGSTRMKSGTAAKLILNMISTSVMILGGHVQGNKMVDMQLTNKKLVDRGARMILEKTGMTDYDRARALLLEHGSVRAAVEAYKSEQA
ncbi:MAG: N-acetylmuramic acid 6-phosphate etherase [Bacteroidales bacterium]|nr:N-acetylmuramic acid 6-phosphate etherase [Bacteroidales bacterium]